MIQISKNKICLVAINAQYIHTNLAVRLLKNLDTNDRTLVLEHTINTNINNILDDIMLREPVCVMFSVYIWNINYVMILADSIKKISPETIIIVSGPEVSHNGISILEQHQAVDIVSFAIGEINFTSIIDAVYNKDFSNVDGIFYRENDKILHNDVMTTYSINQQEFPYYDIENVKDKILYFETSRGCPFNCSYCMSGDSAKIDLMNLDIVRKMLKRFVESNCKQVKFVDRTFNYPIQRAIEIIRIINELKKEYPDSPTSFHCEINPSIITKEFLDVLSTLPKNLVQFEIGIQSTNDDTLEAISRKCNVKKQIENIKKIIALNNIKTYVDLIAGLPYETYNIFKDSFNAVYKTNCDVIHLGFLKILKGSKMEKECEEHGIIYRDYPPYEILRSDYISYSKLSKLKKIEQLVDTYKNSGNFANTLNYAISNFETSFMFFEMYCGFLLDNDYFGRPHKFTYYYDMIFDFLSCISSVDIDYLKEIILHDYSLNSKPRNYPQCLGEVVSDYKKEVIREFYNNEELTTKHLPEYAGLTPSTMSRQCNIEIFNYDLYNCKHLDKPYLILYKYKGEKSFTIIEDY